MTKAAHPHEHLLTLSAEAVFLEDRFPAPAARLVLHSAARLGGRDQPHRDLLAAALEPAGGLCPFLSGGTPAQATLRHQLCPRHAGPFRAAARGAGSRLP